MSYASKGNDFENRVAKWLESLGYIVGSRRHRKGGGDLIAWKPGTLGTYELLLVECKRTKRPYLSPAERESLIDTARKFDATPRLAWAAGPESRIHLIGPDDDRWPGR